jgi:hypothetical protein
VFYNIIARIFLDLKDLGQSELLVSGGDRCLKCGNYLRLGEDKNAYCPKCLKKIRTVTMPRFQPGIKVDKHDD